MPGSIGTPGIHGLLGKRPDALDRFFEISIRGRQICALLIGSQRFDILLRNFVRITQFAISVHVVWSLG